MDLCLAQTNPALCNAPVTLEKFAEELEKLCGKNKVPKFLTEQIESLGQVFKNLNLADNAQCAARIEGIIPVDGAGTLPCNEALPWGELLITPPDQESSLNIGSLLKAIKEAGATEAFDLFQVWHALETLKTGQVAELNVNISPETIASEECVDIIDKLIAIYSKNCQERNISVGKICLEILETYSEIDDTGKRKFEPWQYEQGLQALIDIAPLILDDVTLDAEGNLVHPALQHGDLQLSGIDTIKIDGAWLREAYSAAKNGDYTQLNLLAKALSGFKGNVVLEHLDIEQSQEVVEILRILSGPKSLELLLKSLRLIIGDFLPNYSIDLSSITFYLQCRDVSSMIQCILPQPGVRVAN